MLSALQRNPKALKLARLERLAHIAPSRMAGLGASIFQTIEDYRKPLLERVDDEMQYMIGEMVRDDIDPTLKWPVQVAKEVDAALESFLPHVQGYPRDNFLDLHRPDVQDYMAFSAAQGRYVLGELEHLNLKDKAPPQLQSRVAEIWKLFDRLAQGVGASES